MNSRAAYFLLVLVLVASLFFYRLAQEKTRRPLLITGCARSGTSYIMKVLKKSGLVLGHEVVRRDGASSWLMAVDAKEVPEGEGRSGYVFDHIFHQVRHPLKVISSFHSTHPPENHVWDYILSHTPEISSQDPHIVKCAKYWYYWNLKAEAEAEWTYKVEEIDQVWDEFCRRLGKKMGKEGLENIPKDANSVGPIPDFTWNDLKEQIDPDLYSNIQELAEKYGYTETI